MLTLLPDHPISELNYCINKEQQKADGRGESH